MTDLAWIEAALISARPQALGALVRYFRDVEIAEEAFQDASLRALRSWPTNGPPRNPAAWLILVGRNTAIDAARRRRKQTELPDDDLVDADEPALADRLDDANYRDDVLRLLFICCHPELPVTQQVALALRIVSGLTVAQIARAFLVSETAMEQRITRAKQRITRADVPFEAPDANERAARLTAVAAMIYLIFNEGYSAGHEDADRAQLCDEAIRLGRLLLSLFPGEPEIMGLTALLQLQHSRSPARFDDDGDVVLLDAQDRTQWNRSLIDEGLAMLDKAVRHRRPGPYQVQAAIAALHARAPHAAATDWAQIELLYASLERLQPSPVVTLNRAVAVSKAQGPAAALEMIEPLAGPLDGYFHFHGVKGALLQQLGRNSEARHALDRAISLANTAAEAAHIRMHLDQLTSAVGSRSARSSLSKGATMPKITTFLTYSKHAEDAVKLYTSVFKNSKITNTTRYVEGAPLPAGSVMTIEFELDGQPFTALNGGQSFTFTEGISLSVDCENQAEIDEYTEKLTAGGGKQQPCGWITDRFGVSWQIVPKGLHKMIADKDATKATRVLQAVWRMQKLDIAKLKQAYEG
jgi:RNA polymerase sigma-70 factor (ECF subfamily)